MYIKNKMDSPASCAISCAMFTVDGYATSTPQCSRMIDLL